MATTFFLICQGAASVAHLPAAECKGNSVKLSTSKVPGGSIGRKSSIRRRQAVTVPKASVGSNLKTKTRKEKVKGAIVNELTEGAYFGEVGLLSATNRNTSTVQAISDSFVACMSRENFENMLKQFGDPLKEAFYERLLDYGAVDEQIVMLRNIEALRDIDKRQLLRIALALRVEHFRAGEVIMRQG